MNKSYHKMFYISHKLLRRKGEKRKQSMVVLPGEKNMVDAGDREFSMVAGRAIVDC